MILANVLKLKVAFDCHENTLYPLNPVILSNSIIKGGEFSNCHSRDVLIFPWEPELHYMRYHYNTSVYNVSCGSLLTYPEHIQVNETIDYLKDEPLPVYDCSTSSCYFARGFSAQLSVSADAPGAARIYVCWFTNPSDYAHFLSIGAAPSDYAHFLSIGAAPSDGKGKGCVMVLELSQDGTEFKNMVTINSMLPSYYFVGIRVEREVVSLQYYFTTERSFYNRSDFGKTPDCIISNTESLCYIDQLSGETCIMLYAGPETNANSSSYFPLALHELNGKPSEQQQKRDASIALWVLTSLAMVISFILCIIFPSILVYKRMAIRKTAVYLN